MIPISRNESTPLPAFRTGPRFFQVLRAVRESTLTSTERLVLVMLAGRGGDERAPCPGIATIAADTGLATRTVERTLASLAAKGWLSWRSAASSYGTNVYQLRPQLERSALPTDDRMVLDDPRPTIGEQPSRDRPYPDPVPDDLPAVPIDPLCAPTEATEPHPMPTRENTHTESSGSSEAADTLLAALAAHAELRPIASPGLAARLAAEVDRGVPLPDALRALEELAGHAGDAAAAGAPWPHELLRRRARTYIARATAARPSERQEPPAQRAKVLRPAEPPKPGDLASSASALRAFLGSVQWGRSARQDCAA